MRWNKKKQSQYTEKDTNSTSANTPSPSPTDTLLSKYYHSINELPLTNFIECIIDDVLHPLIISGEPKLEELKEAWEKIKIQYGDAMMDGDYRRLVGHYVEIARLEICMKQYDLLTTTLRDYYCKPFADRLNKLLSASFKFDVTKPDEYDNELKRAHNRSRSFIIAIGLEKSKAEVLEKKMHTGQLTRKYFDDMMIEVSDHAGFELNESAMTVYKFCQRVQRLTRYAESLKKKK